MRFRRLAGMVLLLACMAAYWLNFERRFAELEAETALKDPARVLSPRERERLLALRAILGKEYGVSARLVVDTAEGGGTAPPPDVSGNTLYVAVTPQTGAAHVQLPALVKRALAPEYGADPEQRLAQRLKACVRRETPGACLQTTLIGLLATLGEPGLSPNVDMPPPPGVRAPLRTTPPSADARTTQ